MNARESRLYDFNGFWIPKAGFWIPMPSIPMPRIPDSTTKNFLDAGSISLRDIMERRPHWEFFFLDSKAPCSHFHGCVEECCVAPPWTKASESCALFHQSHNPRMLLEILELLPFPALEARWKPDP